MSELVENVLLKRIQELRFVLLQVMEEFNERYDGAEDSHMSWMAELMHDITQVLNKTKQFEK